MANSDWIVMILVSKPTFPFRKTPEAIYPLIPIEVFATVVISNDSELSLFYSDLGFNGNLMKFCGNVETYRVIEMCAIYHSKFLVS